MEHCFLARNFLRGHKQLLALYPPWAQCTMTCCSVHQKKCVELSDCSYVLHERCLWWDEHTHAL